VKGVAPGAVEQPGDEVGVGDGRPERRLGQRGDLVRGERLQADPGDDPVLEEGPHGLGEVRDPGQGAMREEATASSGAAGGFRAR